MRIDPDKLVTGKTYDVEVQLNEEVKQARSMISLCYPNSAIPLMLVDSIEIGYEIQSALKLYEAKDLLSAFIGLVENLLKDEKIEFNTRNALRVLMDRIEKAR